MSSPAAGGRWLPRPSAWCGDALRTNLWLIPTLEVAAATGLFAATYAADRAASRGDVTLPGWVNSGSADAARQILIGIAAAVITVVGLVFSITIVALTLASTQFGPRMLRNFIRDRGTQATLGTFVATFVFAVLALGSIGDDFVPHLAITVELALVLVSLGVLIYFIHHVAKSIQLPEVIASIARDLTRAIDAEAGASGSGTAEDCPVDAGLSVAEIELRMEESGAPVAAARSGYLQFVAYDVLVGIAAQSDAVIRLHHRPGHFVVQGLPLATVWPAASAERVAQSLERAHFTGPHRTLAQDLSFAIDQLVEIAIRALSPAVNDTFTALTCIDWLSSALCRITVSWAPPAARAKRDGLGYVRVVSARISYERLVGRAFHKVRQASRGMPAVMIRQLDALARVMVYASTDEQRAVLRDQADMILRASHDSVPEERDRADVDRAYEVLEAVRLGMA